MTVRASIGIRQHKLSRKEIGRGFLFYLAHAHTVYGPGRVSQSRIPTADHFWCLLITGELWALLQSELQKGHWSGRYDLTAAGTAVGKWPRTWPTFLPSHGDNLISMSQGRLPAIPLPICVVFVYCSPCLCHTWKFICDREIREGIGP